MFQLQLFLLFFLVSKNKIIWKKIEGNSKRGKEKEIEKENKEKKRI